MNIFVAWRWLLSSTAARDHKAWSRLMAFSDGSNNYDAPNALTGIRASLMTYVKSACLSPGLFCVDSITTVATSDQGPFIGTLIHSAHSSSVSTY